MQILTLKQAEKAFKAVSEDGYMTDTVIEEGTITLGGFTLRRPDLYDRLKKVIPYLRKRENREFWYMYW